MTDEIDGHQVDVTLASTTRAPREARDILRKFGPGLPEGILADATLLVSELVTNTVRHASAGPRSRVHLRVAELSGGVRVEVADWGPGFSLCAVGPREDSGFGLLLVRRLATRWGIERDDTTRVWFEIVRPDAGVPADDHSST